MLCIINKVGYLFEMGIQNLFKQIYILIYINIYLVVLIMKKIYVILVFFLFIITIFLPTLNGDKSIQEKIICVDDSLFFNDTCKILFIGSSYFNFNSLPVLFESLSLSFGKDVYIDHHGSNGLYLDDHASRSDTESKINEQDWDYIILQGVGTNTAYPDYYTGHPLYPALEILRDKINQNCESTKIVYCMPWAFEDGMTWYQDWTDTYADMQEKIFDTTLQYSNDIGFIIAPVGWAWYSVLEEQGYPLHYLHLSDWNHPSIKGSYLMACVIFSTIFLENSIGLSYHGGLLEEEANYFQTIASNIVLDNLDLWNIDEKPMIYVDGGNNEGPWDGTSENPYLTIQEGINAANVSDKVFVCEGTYFENIAIDKTISIIGENQTKTIIDGGGRDDVVSILSDRVLFTGFTVQHSISELENGLWWKAGIRVLGSHVVIDGNIIQDNQLGIFAKQTEDITIRNNLFFNDSITFYPYDTGYSSRPELEREHFIHCVEDNFVNGKPVIYLVDRSNLQITGEVGQVILVNCTNIRIRNITVSHVDFPVLFVFCSDCGIENSKFTHNDGVCTLLNSDGNNIQANLFEDGFHGFLLDYFSENNLLVHNVFSGNQFCGVVCEESSNKNMIIENDFFDNNLRNAFIINAFRNQWSGNYWDDWIGLKYTFFQSFPKVITGSIFDSYQQIKSLFNFDPNPSMSPYGIR